MTNINESQNFYFHVTNILYIIQQATIRERELGPEREIQGSRVPRDGRGSGGAMETLGACREGCWIEENTAEINDWTTEARVVNVYE